jgi:divalent metal cation (Fe/Co/Zn/Cd) transporter
VGRAQLAAVGAAGFLVLLKAVAAWLTSSLALGAAALDSAVDVFVSSASYFVVRRSAAPPMPTMPMATGGSRAQSRVS